MASNCPDLKYCALEEPISVTAVDLKSNLKAPATMETNKETVFSMLVVRGPVWPILFGENHLHGTKALVIDHYVPAVAFWNPIMQFRIQCFLGNPFKGFTTVLAPNASLSQKAEKQRPSNTSVLRVFLLWHHQQVFTNVHNTGTVLLTLLWSVSPFLQL